MSQLVIVESPAKAKTIQKYMGKDFASGVHGPCARLAKIQVRGNKQNGFVPQYEEIKGKGVADIRREEGGEKADESYRHRPRPRGEAIAGILRRSLSFRPT